MTSARDKLRAFFEAHVGKVVDADALHRVAGIHEWARRVRELRDDEGMQIRSHKDDSTLKPGEYVLMSPKRRAERKHGISGRVRNQVFERDGFTCQLCGHAANDPNPLDPRRKLKLHLDHIDPSGPSDDSKTRVAPTCSSSAAPSTFLRRCGRRASRISLRS